MLLGGFCIVAFRSWCLWLVCCRLRDWIFMIDSNGCGCAFCLLLVCCIVVGLCVLLVCFFLCLSWCFDWLCGCLVWLFVDGLCGGWRIV